MQETNKKTDVAEKLLPDGSTNEDFRLTAHQLA